MSARFFEPAPAKVNLTLRILGRRADGYHDLESLVVFARLADQVTLALDAPLGLDLDGPTAAAAGDVADNLVLRAAHELVSRTDGLRLGGFTLAKRIPVAAGLGGGSSDAAAALRLLMRVNGIARNNPRVMEAARATGADVPVCLDPRPRIMRGIGEVLSPPHGSARHRATDHCGARAAAARRPHPTSRRRGRPPPASASPIGSGRSADRRRARRARGRP